MRPTLRVPASEVVLTSVVGFVAMLASISVSFS
jgi:hypothetical protein